MFLDQWSTPFGSYRAPDVELGSELEVPSLVQIEGTRKVHSAVLSLHACFGWSRPVLLCLRHSGPGTRQELGAKAIAVRPEASELGKSAREPQMSI